MVETVSQPEDLLVDEVQSIVLQHANRGMDKLSIHTAGHLKNAATSLLEKRRSKIVLITGFFIGELPDGLPENDGPVGAAQLAQFLLLSGWDVEVLTDTYCAPAILQSKAALNATFTVKVISERDDILALRNHWQSATDSPSHVISIERVGPAKDGKSYNMTGRDISQTTAPLHLLFEGRTTPPAYTTITIADGVNEIGMGFFDAAAMQRLEELDRNIQCTISVDHLVLAGVSNWGATALAGAMTLHDPTLIPNLTRSFGPAFENEIVQSLFREKTAVDGVKRTFSENSVDGISTAIGNQITESVLKISTAET